MNVDYELYIIVLLFAAARWSATLKLLPDLYASFDQRH